MRLRWIVMSLCVVAWDGCTSPDPSYCNLQTPCPEGQRCNFELRTCVPADDDAGVNEAGLLLALGQPCSDPSACQSGKCTDGVCCEQDSCGTCKKCGADGKCAPRAADDPPPAGECPGDKECGADQCDGKGNCAFKALNATCQTTCSAASFTTYTCKAGNLCQANGPAACPDFVSACADATSCLTGCKTHADCIAGSVCDRRNAHVTGTGVCIDPALVVTVAAGGKIQAAIDAAGIGTYLRIAAGKYDEQLTLSGKHLALIGDGEVVVEPSTEGSCFAISDSSDVAIQGLTVQGASGVMDPSGAGCGVLCMHSVVSIVDSTVGWNTQIGVGGDCDFNLHRDVIRDNLSGLELFGNKSSVTDTLIHRNNIGVTLYASVSMIFVNNTVVNNIDNRPIAEYGGVDCMLPVTIRNNIIMNNSPKDFTGCTFDHSDVFPNAPNPAPPAAGNLNEFCSFDNTTFKPAAGSKCTNSGDNAGVSAIDLNGEPRIKGGTVDMGAYEVE